ncbi:hypothetical protein [Sphingomonas nostoxanthinifaciens]|uniref:hypothetical protein n=1 Tax=Sphingomonas nostoxanthinifaciens TaxID=2872652 RepID=UPI001CC1C5AB|nr:hypothetical protein [Sphingomonas nostoxanthinifaciens]UAK23920.1 hypothetical protein K8P63_16380 [Sphingomonas nostoxanthinifaciens]
MPRETPSPIDLPGPALLNGSGIAWATTVIAVATLVLLLTNAVALRDWIDEQRPSPVQAYAATAADGWVAFTDTIGLGAPRAAMHGQWKRAEAARFAGQPPTDDARQ